MFFFFVDGDPILLALLLANGSFIIETNDTYGGPINTPLVPGTSILLYCISFFDTTAEVSDHQYLPK